MSHVATVNVEVKDLAALKAAVKELGAEFVENVRTYKWYGRSVGDYPLPKGMKASDLGKCDHVIRVPGVQYEVGIVKRGNGYVLAYDFWGPGQGLLKAFGKDCTRLVQMYGVHKATQEARRKGLSVQRVAKKDGTVQLRIGGIR
jgi:hypothetical protein